MIMGHTHAFVFVASTNSSAHSFRTNRFFFFSSIQTQNVIVLITLEFFDSIFTIWVGLSAWL